MIEVLADSGSTETDERFRGNWEQPNEPEFAAEIIASCKQLQLSAILGADPSGVDYAEKESARSPVDVGPLHFLHK